MAFILRVSAIVTGTLELQLIVNNSFHNTSKPFTTSLLAFSSMQANEAEAACLGKIPGWSGNP